MKKRKMNKCRTKRMTELTKKERRKERINEIQLK
jgi:hypothetical protein